MDYLNLITIPVYMTEEEAKRFLLYQKYYEVFKKLDEVKAFDVQFGKVTLNIHSGKIQNVVREEVCYHI